jgi:outer membrane protein OmpA-like peptidoglycan-associated protein
MLAACSTPPKPQTVDGTNRTAVNDAETASVLSLRADLAETKPAVVHPAPPPAPVSHTVTVHFPFNSAHLQPTAAQEAELLPLLANVRRIEVRGRTDTERPSAGDERIALKRAQAAMNYLVARGVPATKVSVNYLSGGDHVAEGGTAVGRAQNRRVEIEVFNQ